MKLIANECANCRRPVGYVVEGTLCLPTLCLLCAADKEVMKEWGHHVSRKEKTVGAIAIDYRFNLNRMALRNDSWFDENSGGAK